MWWCVEASQGRTEQGGSRYFSNLAEVGEEMVGRSGEGGVGYEGSLEWLDLV